MGIHSGFLIENNTVMENMLMHEFVQSRISQNQSIWLKKIDEG